MSGEAVGKRNAVFSIDKKIHNNFKTVCANRGIGMSIVIERAMQAFTAKYAPKQHTK